MNFRPILASNKINIFGTGMTIDCDIFFDKPIVAGAVLQTALSFVLNLLWPGPADQEQEGQMQGAGGTGGSAGQGLCSRLLSRRDQPGKEALG